MPSATCAPREQPEHVAAAGAPAWRQRRHGDPLPDEREERERHDEEEGAAPADDAAEIAAERRRDRGGDGVAGVQHREPLRHRVPRQEAHDDRGRHRPEATDRDPEQRAPDHQHPVVRRERDQGAGEDQEHRERRQHDLAVDVAGQPGDEEAGHHREEARDRDRLSGLSLGDAQIGRDRGQEADRHELRRDQHGHAERHRADRAPGGARSRHRSSPPSPASRAPLCWRPNLGHRCIAI